MPNLGYKINTLVVTIASPVNNSANVTLSNVNVNVAALMGPDSAIGADYSALAETLTIRGIWSNNQFYPARWITLITAI